MENQIFALWLQLVADNKTTKAVEEARAIRKFWRAMVLGIGQSEIIVIYNKPEDDSQKKLRKRVTNSKTRYVTSKIFTTYCEVDRSDRIVLTSEHSDENALGSINKNALSFYGDQSIDGFLNENLKHYAAADPNAFLLYNSKPYERETGEPDLYPSIIESTDLRLWHFDCNDLQALAFKVGAVEHLWLKDRSYTIITTDKITPEEAERQSAVKINLPKNSSVNLKAWTLEKGIHDIRITIPVVKDESPDSNNVYLIEHSHGLGTIPAFRMGWVKSFEHETDVLESMLLPAKERYEELMQKKSKYDTHLAVHGIAKEIIYLPKCNNVVNNMVCIDGKINGEKCGKCKGSGKMPIHKSELDIFTIEITMDDQTMELIDASKLHQYVEIPKHIIDMHKEASEEASKDVALALFNTNVFNRAELTAATATEVIQNNKSIDNALYAYASHKSHLTKQAYKTIALWRGKSDNFKIEIKVPTSLYEETEDELYMRLKLAHNAGAPPQVTQNVVNQILAKQNADSPERIAYARSLSKLKPFSGLTETERLALFAGLPPNHIKRKTLLYFDDIIYELDANPQTANWFKLKPKEQKTLFDKTLQGVIDRLEPEADPGPIVIDVPDA